MKQWVLQGELLQKLLQHGSGARMRRHADADMMTAAGAEVDLPAAPLARARVSCY
jgi:hypothetical protein